jgi:hypothetical protein
MVEKKENGFDEIVDQLRGIRELSIMSTYTWIHLASAMQNHVSVSDAATRKGINAMIRQSMP